MIRKALTILALILAVLLVVSAAGCASVELTQQKSADRKITFLAAGAAETGRTMFWMWSMG